MRLPQRPATVAEMLTRVPPERMPRLLLGLSPTTGDGKYRHWDTIRRMTPPLDLSPEEWWLATKVARSSMMKELPVTDSEGEPFTCALPDAALAMLHIIDKRASRKIAISEVVTNPATRDRYVVNSLIEEAITSSQLEGAVTSRVIAKEMLRSGRAPRDTSERMILNNYRAINFVRQHRKDRLTPALVCDLQRIVTEDTPDDSAQAGRIQQPDEDRVRVEAFDGQVVHVPPPASELPDRMDAMCQFANGEYENGFLHPVVRAVLLHFWLAYDHPFADGNGRAARALFYWSMLNQDYWLAEYLSISRILRNAPAQYARAFLYTETDANDTTYFLLFQLKVICRAIEDFYGYLERKVSEVRSVEELLPSVNFNHRQLALVGHALRSPSSTYTYRSHANSNGVVRQSARSDLLDLEEKGLLARRRVGNRFVFSAAPDLANRLKELAEAAE